MINRNRKGINMKKKNKKKKELIILNRNVAMITSIFVGIIVSIFGAKAFYNIITKVAPRNYDASFIKTMFTVAPLIFIGISIVLLSILLVSQTSNKD